MGILEPLADYFVSPPNTKRKKGERKKNVSDFDTQPTHVVAQYLRQYSKSSAVPCGSTNPNPEKKTVFSAIRIVRSVEFPGERDV